MENSESDAPSFDPTNKDYKPSWDEILKIIDKMQISDSEKEQMIENLKQRQDAFKNGIPDARKFVPLTMDYILIIFWIVMLLIIGEYLLTFLNIQRSCVTNFYCFSYFIGN